MWVSLFYICITRVMIYSVSTISLIADEQTQHEKEYLYIFKNF